MSSSESIETMKFVDISVRHELIDLYEAVAPDIECKFAQVLRSWSDDLREFSADRLGIAEDDSIERRRELAENFSLYAEVLYFANPTALQGDLSDQLCEVFHHFELADVVRGTGLKEALNSKDLISRARAAIKRVGEMVQEIRGG